MMAVELRGPGLVLRPHETGDAAAMFAAIEESKVELAQWMSWYRAGFSLEDARSWIDHCRVQWSGEGDREFGIFDADTGEILGCAGVNQLNRVHEFANVGYWVRTSRTRRGIGTTTVRLLAAFAFRGLGLRRVEILTLPENAASRRVAEKAGARYECIARGRLMHQGTPRDAAMHAILASDLIDN